MIGILLVGGLNARVNSGYRVSGNLEPQTVRAGLAAVPDVAPRTRLLLERISIDLTTLKYVCTSILVASQGIALPVPSG